MYQVDIFPLYLRYNLDIDDESANKSIGKKWTVCSLMYFKTDHQVSLYSLKNKVMNENNV